ncbi:MAG: hypothetical protein JNM76_13465 [Betaproteobacteria bacterium]|nr:hypothetical protein [Betaproteobacteria bacterium]
MKLSRRRFLQVGVTGAVVLGAAAWLNHEPDTPAQGLRALSRREAELIRALAPVILAGMIPTDATARQTALNEVVEAFDRGLAGMSLAVQGEVKQLLGLLTFAPSRALVAGVWTSWPEASESEVAAFLMKWQSSRFVLLRAGYQAMKQLMQACWFGNPLAWPAMGYALPDRAREFL